MIRPPPRSTRTDNSFPTRRSSDLPSELKVPASNLTTALAGRIAGMIAYQRSGEPGRDNADFFIRGVTTFAESRPDPLILIDGIELTRSEEHTSELQSLMRISYAVFCLQKKKREINREKYSE